MIDLRHKCGGWLEHWSNSGMLAYFHCEKCGADVAVTACDQEALARRDKERVRWSAERAALPEPVPSSPIRTASRVEAMALAAYQWWSEETYAAGFMSPDRDRVAEFIEQLDRTRIYDLHEVEMLRHLRDQWPELERAEERA